MTDQEDDVIINEETLLGDLIVCTLDRIKELDRPWHQLSESEQERVIDGLEYYIKKGVEKACLIINDRNVKATIRANLDRVTVTDGIKAVLKIDGDDEGRHELIDHTKRNVQVVICDVMGGLTQEGKPKADKDQPELELEEEEADHSETEDALAEALEAADSEADTEEASEQVA